MERNDSQQTREAFQRCYDFMQANYGEPVFGQDFYEYIFPDNEKQSEQRQEFSKPNALYLYQPDPISLVVSFHIAVLLCCRFPQSSAIAPLYPSIGGMILTEYECPCI